MIPEEPTQEHVDEILSTVVDKRACLQWVKGHAFNSETYRRAAILLVTDEITTLLRDYQNFHKSHEEATKLMEASEKVKRMDDERRRMQERRLMRQERPPPEPQEKPYWLQRGKRKW